ncbi:YcjX family protein [Rhizobium sp. KVB221]|uniref:YcjX family protein n=1 Tax=Rhizobium setariae TaxID=2801340 RepID=A0A937CPL1_9HYPH|nr:YcjX family protein [Rhizobium setariae]MBL0375036.1 YcjX family protein [Rhizobium setariae]
MPPSPTNIADEAIIAFENLADKASGILNPSLRLGVTGLSRAGKTVFISALIHNLINDGRLPLFEAKRAGRIKAVRLEEQPDDAVPRFQYEDHIRALIGKRLWPDSTKAISELRLTIEFESASAWSRMFSAGKLSIDIVDYPGEWLMDLPLLEQDYRTFSENAVKLASTGSRRPLGANWTALAAGIDPDAPADEMKARDLAVAFTAYLKACKDDKHSFSALAPGRFLMPGDLDGSPALTFAPLLQFADGRPAKGSFHAMMERRYEAYKTHVVKPFFREHFARLDRQIVLVDTLQAINRGPEALADLESALGDVLSSFRPGTNSFLSSFFTRKIDRVLVAATKADHLHHESHDRLEAITRRLVDRAIANIGRSGAGIEVLALASVRATREASVTRDGEKLPVIVGTPIENEEIGGEIFDGERKTAIFPGDLPENPDIFFDKRASEDLPSINAVRFRPPELEDTGGGIKLSLPHIRLDRALQFLIGDRLA